MKVIFLDVDGVLNNMRSYRKRSMILRTKQEEIIPLEDFMFKHLKKLVDDTGATIVLSSSWRYDLVDYVEEPEETEGYYYEYDHRWIKALLDKFKEHGIPFYNKNYTGVDLANWRGTEIGNWLFEHNTEEDPIESFVILDDTTDLAPFRQFHVETNFLEGLRANHVRRAKFILENYKFDPSRYVLCKDGETGNNRYKKVKNKG